MKRISRVFACLAFAFAISSCGTPASQDGDVVSTAGQALAYADACALPYGPFGVLSTTCSTHAHWRCYQLDSTHVGHCLKVGPKDLFPAGTPGSGAGAAYWCHDPVTGAVHGTTAGDALIWWGYNGTTTGGDCQGVPSLSLLYGGVSAGGFLTDYGYMIENSDMGAYPGSIAETTVLYIEPIGASTSVEIYSGTGFNGNHMTLSSPTSQVLPTYDILPGGESIRSLYTH